MRQFADDDAPISEFTITLNDGDGGRSDPDSQGTKLPPPLHTEV